MADKYVHDMNPQELRAHMQRLQKMAGWHNPLDDALFAEITRLDGVIRELERAQPAAVAAVPEGYANGVHAAAAWLDKRREEHADQFGAVDPDTGALEFRSIHQEEYNAELMDLADGIRADLLAAAEGAQRRGTAMTMRASRRVPGVTWRKSTNKWRVDISRHGRLTYLGAFDDFFLAVCARKSMEVALFGDDAGAKPLAAETASPFDYFNAVLRYDPETGDFFWKVNRSGSAVIGAKAGTIIKSGYILLRVDNKAHLAHRVAWLLTFGRWPEKLLDHIDGDKQCNRIANLREANFSQNCANTRSRTSGKPKGVHPSGFRFRAVITDGKGGMRHLGRFDTEDEAAHAYNKAAIATHGEFAVLNPIGGTFINA